MNNTFACLIPAPQRICVDEKNSLKISDINSFFAENIFNEFADDIRELFADFYLKSEAAADSENAQFTLRLNSALPPEAFSIVVTTQGITLSASDRAGIIYALSACRQMFFAAMICGPLNARLNCGQVEDFPRFAFRSFHLDSARHFQNTAVIKRMLKLMSQFRLNYFHWHLVDSQGWRLQLKTTAGLENKYTSTPGFYTADNIKEIIDFAARLNISIIPEVDFPGHSLGTLQYFPQYACINAEKPREFCLGNPESKMFIKNVLREIMDLFPASQYIHIGGDEAASTNWDKCPLCQTALKAENCSNIRELENKFMCDIARFVIDSGRQPIIWGTCSGQTYQAQTTIQAWLDIREPLRVAPNGNKVIYSVHTSLYFDYPANLSEPWETWMFELSERGVYMTDPFIIWPDKVKDVIIGTEACLWTETVPQWRVIPKLLPRLYAYSECAWSMPERKDYQDFCRRKELLEAAGYMDYLVSAK